MLKKEDPISRSETLSQEIDLLDRFHTLRVAKRSEGVDLIKEIDTFLGGIDNEDVTFSGLGDLWVEVSRDLSFSISKRILSHDLAYNMDEIPLDKADAFAKDYLSLFSSEARFFFNGKFGEGHRFWSGVGSVANSTFDTGVVAIDSSYVGILWCHDED